MPESPRSERRTQSRVVQLLTGAAGLGYRYLGEWSKRDGNRCIETDILRANLVARGYSSSHVSAALFSLAKASEITGGDSLYAANLRVYQLLRYGVSVQIAAGSPHETVHLIDWENEDRNDFALAEEVTLKGGHERRPDLVLYVNGLAVTVIELKRSSVEIGDGVRQLISNQEPIFNQSFFATAQLLIAGSDSQGLRYGTATTDEKFFVEWKAAGDTKALAEGALLDRPLAELCAKSRLLDIIRNFVIFDGGRKKVPRPHQFAGVKAAQERVAKGEGGVIWHTQGSGKSILMVLLAKWLLEHDPHGRVLIITDRDELDKQIEGVMRNANVIGPDAPSPRITSRAEFTAKLSAPAPRLLCALLHKFEPDLQAPAPRLHGRFYVFVDECHRTQGGDMNRQMKRWLNEAIFIGFTGTPLLRRDRQTTNEVFGSFIHTYKFHEAVADEVILDLKYEARHVDQRLAVHDSVDTWFEEKTRNLNNYQKAVLRRQWATMEKLMSSQERKERIVADILHDFGVRPRLNNDRGTAILVAASIYDACHYFRLLQNTWFAPHCGIITSYEPNHNAISREPPNSDERYKFDTYTKYVLSVGQTTKAYEDVMKNRFIKEPANCKLLIVVSKLLTGFDAPTCTYIYLDHELRDHNLFQAICRTNRLDGEDKPYGHIVDYKELFHDVQNSIAVYTSDEIDTDVCGSDANVTVKDWLVEGKKKLDAAREALFHLVEPVPPPREVEQYLRYFCGDIASPTALQDTEPLRIAYYKATAALVRAFAEITQHLTEAGYTVDQAVEIRKQIEFHAEIRAAIKKHSGEELDIKPYEAEMRHLINTYIQADHAVVLGDLEGLTLTEQIVKTGIHDAIARQLNERRVLSKNSVAEAIVNNLRKTIIREQLTDPKYYSEMSALLDDLIKQGRESADAYQKWLQQAEALAKRIVEKSDGEYPGALANRAEAITIYRNLAELPSKEFQCPTEPDAKAHLALEIDKAMRENAPAGWKGDEPKERIVQNFLHKLLSRDKAATFALFEIIKNQSGY